MPSGATPRADALRSTTALPRSVWAVTRRKIARDGTRFTLGIVGLTVLLALVQIVSCNVADDAGEGSWIMPCWVYEEEAVIDGTASLRVSESEVIQVPRFRIDHHWHPLAVAGWSVPPATALLAAAIAIRRRNGRLLKLGAMAALVVIAAAYLISPRVAWHIGPRSPGPSAPGGEVMGVDEAVAQHVRLSSDRGRCRSV